MPPRVCITDTSSGNLASESLTFASSRQDDPRSIIHDPRRWADALIDLGSCGNRRGRMPTAVRATHWHLGNGKTRRMWSSHGPSSKEPQIAQRSRCASRITAGGNNTSVEFLGRL